MREAREETGWIDPDPGFEARRARRRRRRPTTIPRLRAADRGAVRRDDAGGPVELAGAEARAADHAGRARRLSGHRALGGQPGRPRQPPAGRLRAPGRRCSPSSMPRAAPPPIDDVGRAKLWLVVAHPAAAPRPSGPVRRLPADPRPPGRSPTTSSPSTAAARSPSPPGCRSAWRSRGGFGDTAIDARADATSTRSPAPSSRGRTPRRRHPRDLPGCATSLARREARAGEPASPSNATGTGARGTCGGNAASRRRARPAAQCQCGGCSRARRSSRSRAGCGYCGSISVSVSYRIRPMAQLR